MAEPTPGRCDFKGRLWHDGQCPQRATRGIYCGTHHPSRQQKREATKARSAAIIASHAVLRDACDAMIHSVLIGVGKHDCPDVIWNAAQSLQDALYRATEGIE